jgi:hypothetical protein
MATETERFEATDSKVLWVVIKKVKSRTYNFALISRLISELKIC